jgi:peptidyl-dipeptidase Dcp
VGFRHRARHFGHIFSGGGMYAAGYYAYQWAAVLDSDGYEAFEQAGDPFDPGLAGRLSALLAAGDGRDPMALYREFRGREPDPDALLRRLGLLAAG